MIDFVLAALLFLGVMFVVTFCLSFATIAVTYTAVKMIKYCLQWFRHPDFVFTK